MRASGITIDMPPGAKSIATFGISESEALCQCGAVAAIERDRWPTYVQLAAHGQPRTGLLCSPFRLQKKNA